MWFFDGSQPRAGLKAVAEGVFGFLFKEGT